MRKKRKERGKKWVEMKAVWIKKNEEKTDQIIFIKFFIYILILFLLLFYLLYLKNWKKYDRIYVTP